ncbi:MAG: hypothetical protein Q4D51_00610 [Eubacteriales bacterium]|nr:hypothetical protein [Eubacteriales bacterium]
MSDSFTKKTEEPELEVKVTVYNINVGNNKSFIEKCSVLREYMIFVDKVRECVASGVNLEEAIDLSIDECIRENVLKEFLSQRGNEVRKVMTLDYTWEKREELIREEEREEGRKEGREEGEINKLINLIQKKLEKGKSFAQIADEIEEEEAVVKDLITKYL